MLRITTKQHHPAGGCWGQTQSAHGQFCTPKTSGEVRLLTENGPKTRPQLGTPSVPRPPIEGYRRHSPTGWTYGCLWVHRIRKSKNIRMGAHIEPFRGSALGMAKPSTPGGPEGLSGPHLPGPCVPKWEVPSHHRLRTPITQVHAEHSHHARLLGPQSAPHHGFCPRVPPNYVAAGPWHRQKE